MRNEINDELRNKNFTTFKKQFKQILHELYEN